MILRCWLTTSEASAEPTSNVYWTTTTSMTSVVSLNGWQTQVKHQTVEPPMMLFAKNIVIAALTHTEHHQNPVLLSIDGCRE